MSAERPYVPDSEAQSRKQERHVDPRHEGVVREARFFEPYNEEIKKLFGALGRQERWSENPRILLKYIIPAWAGGEHGNHPDKEQFTEQQIEAARPALDEMGLTEEVLPPAGIHYKDIVIVGGTTTANYRSMEMILDIFKNNGNSADQITFWYGQRPRQDRDGSNDELLATDGRFGGNDITQNPWVQQEMAKAENGESFATETHVGRVALLKLAKNGETLMPVTKGEVFDAAKHTAGETKDDTQELTDYEFAVPIDTADGEVTQKIVLLNAAAQERPQGVPRHTTESSAKEWMERYRPDENARVLFISTNPHTMRTALDVFKVLSDAGRDDIQMDVAGKSMSKTAPIQSALGEVAWLILKDVERNQSEGKVDLKNL